MTLDYLLVGQGLAGTILSHTLRSAGCATGVVDAARLPSSSRVAAGIFNPLTGKQPVKTWQAEALFSFLPPFYREMETRLGERFFHPKPFYRPFRTVEEQNRGISLTGSPALGTWLRSRATDPETADFLLSHLGGLETLQAGYVAVDRLLRAYRSQLVSEGMLFDRPFSFDALQVFPDGVAWQGIRARRLIFCEGSHAVSNPYFRWLPFRPVKGEILTVEIHARVPDRIFKQGVFLVPQEHGCKVGATYERNCLGSSPGNDFDWQPTPGARQEMTSTLSTWLKPAYRVLKQEAGIRPATFDRRPFIGLHPKYPALGIFNGLGSKGVSIAPYYARHFYEFLECGKELAGEVNIRRGFSLHSNENPC
ncbi:MAG: FAD-binding oxidoreductase [Ferruginibacter sp.]|nr:FAD-binding oxidoreductase [Cytophagales bacterium]